MSSNYIDSIILKEEVVNMNNGKIFWGLDIGTDSVGYAATDNSYKLKKFKGEPVWGSHVFEAANLCKERRSFRTSRRTNDRKQFRVLLIREIFAKEINKVDKNFYKRLDESALRIEDRTTSVCKYTYFNDNGFGDKEYNKKYPTIHHLIVDLMNSEKKFDARLVYLAISYLVAHRGHFLFEVDKNNIDLIRDIKTVYNNFENYFVNNDLELPWSCDIELFSNILTKKEGIKAKESELLALLFEGKKPKISEDDTYNRVAMVKLLCGGSVKPKDLLCNSEYNDLPSISLGMKDEDFQALICELDDNGGNLLLVLKKLYDWSILANIIGKNKSISEAKVTLYNQHKTDLKNLKAFIRKYRPDKYNEIFKYGANKLNNYVAYSYNIKSVKREDALKVTKSSKEDFLKYIYSIVKNIDVIKEDLPFYNDMLTRIQTQSFLPKQVDTDNRVIPYQLYWDELYKILTNAKKYLPFLSEIDSDGITPIKKIMSVFEFKIPYFVGPLRRDNSSFAWIEKKCQGKIYPWNFKEKVDFDKSEQNFINRMVNVCTYLPWERVLPQNSFVYSKFMVLNEINNLKINNRHISTECKQNIFNNLFMQQTNVTVKKIIDFLTANGEFKSGDTLTGIDISIKSSLKSYNAFKKYIKAGKLSYNDAEDIILALAYTEDRSRLIKHLQGKYPLLDKSDRNKIAALPLKDFGRLSYKFLCGIEGTNIKTGEFYPSIIDAMWNTQNNLMQLLSNDFTFKSTIDSLKKEFYQANPSSISEQLDRMYISNSVKRPIIRTLDIVKDLKKAIGVPDKIFVEMARGAKPGEKGKRTSSRREKIQEFYKNFSKSEIEQLSAQLTSKDDRELQSERLYLYFIQLGRCMYSNEPIDINALSSKRYDIDHIYPQCYVKDDSITNKVLVLSELNGEKSNFIPIKKEIRSKMTPFWSMLHKNKLISDEKFARLTRAIPFSNDEKYGFINRQLVETRQSTKAIATLLQEIFPETEIVYVKAGLVSDFRQAYDLLKSRSVNDLHHAKDAYLNIVVGNVYSSCFSKKYFMADRDYSIKTTTLFKYERKCGNDIVWHGENSIAQVKKAMSKNAIHLTRYAFCRKGQLFDQNPVKASSSSALVPRKKELDPAKYGGYTNTTASFFVFVKYEAIKKTDVILMPVELLYADNFLTSNDFAKEYSKKIISNIVSMNILNVQFPLGKRIIKINTVLSFDRFCSCIAAKSNGGKTIGLSSLTSLKIKSNDELYIKKLEAFYEKMKKNDKIAVSEKYDKITKEQNEIIYDLFTDKLTCRPYSLFFSQFGKKLQSGKGKFVSLKIEDQVKCLLNILFIFKTGRTVGCDLSLIGASKQSAVSTVSSSISNWKKYKDVRIVDESPSGLFSNTSDNILNLL